MNRPIPSMTVAEKLEAMEQLWVSLQVDDRLAPPEWHGQILAERQERIDRGEVAFSSLEDVKARLRKRDA